MADNTFAGTIFMVHIVKKAKYDNKRFTSIIVPSEFMSVITNRLNNMQELKYITYTWANFFQDSPGYGNMNNHYSVITLSW